MKTDASIDRFFYIAGWIGIGLAVGYVILSNLLGFRLTEVLPPCAFHFLTGFYCPGCGGTRAVTTLLQGKVMQSLYYHPLVVYTAVIGGWFMISHTIELLSKKKWCIGMHYRNIYLWIALAIIGIHCVVKNVVLGMSGYAMM